MNLSPMLGLTFPERWSTGGITTLIGLGMTFVMLALLIGAIILLRYILKGLDVIMPKCNEKLRIFKEKIRKTKTEAPELPTLTSDEKTDETIEKIDEETMAVIEQSVRKFSANENDGKPHDRIRIVSVKEVKHE